MIDRIHERSVFRRLQREGSYVRVGSLWCSVLIDPTLSAPHVAYALGRKTGNAVVRNRLRRRMREIVRAQANQLPPGYYLLGAGGAATKLSFDALTRLTTQVLSDAGTRGGSR